MLRAIQFPTRLADLNSSLTNMDRNDLPLDLGNEENGIVWKDVERVYS